MNIALRSPKTGKEWEQYYNLRYEVMSKPSGYSKDSVREEKDPQSFHLAAFDGGKIVGVGRFNSDKSLMSE